MDLGFTGRILKEDGTFIAHVPELDVSSCADTEAERAGTSLMRCKDSSRRQGSRARSTTSFRRPAIVSRTAAGVNPSW